MPTRSSARLTLLLAAGALFAACQTATPTPVATHPAPTQTPAPSATPTTAAPTLTSSPTQTPTPIPTAADRIGLTPNGPALLLADLARADLAARLQVAENTITLLSVEEAELTQPNLGCPTGGTEEGPAIPSIVLGYIIRLDAGGQVFEYRATGRRVVFCGN